MTPASVVAWCRQPASPPRVSGHDVDGITRGSTQVSLSDASASVVVVLIQLVPFERIVVSRTLRVRITSKAPKLRDGEVVLLATGRLLHADDIVERRRRHGMTIANLEQLRRRLHIGVFEETSRSAR